MGKKLVVAWLCGIWLLLGLMGCQTAESPQETEAEIEVEEVAVLVTDEGKGENSPTPLAPTLPPPSLTPLPPATATPLPTPEPSPTPLPWPTVLPTAVPTAGASPTPGADQFVNGIQRGWFVVMPDEAGIGRLREVLQKGLELGRDPTRFSKLGDSVTTSPHYLARFDDPAMYELAPYESLQPTIDFFRGSFSHNGPAQRIGLATAVVFDPTWADKELCLPNEHMLDCEIRRHNPAILLIKIGTNDTGTITFEENLRKIIEYTLEQGIIPVLTTKADRFEGGDWNNPIMRRLAAEYAIPLWDFDFVANSLYERGMAEDGIHLSMSNANVYRDPIVLGRGYPVSDLTGLMLLDALRRHVIEPVIIELEE
jgi:hypothetical protein